MDTLDYGNVLVIGGHGVGKSTLIRTVLGADAEVASNVKPIIHGSLDIYESLSVPFRIIDAHNIDGNLFVRRAAIKAVKQWSKGNALDGDVENDINVIWFCIEGKSRKLIRQQLQDLASATDVWRNVPIIVVITKSYAASERKENVELVEEFFRRRRRRARSLRAVIPVVSETFRLDETTFVTPQGIPELIYATTDAMPEGVQAASGDIARFALKRRRSVAHSIVAAATAAGVAVAAVPIPIADAMLLTPIEGAMISGLATLYGINKNSTSKMLFETILEVGTVSAAARALISALKAVPGINIAAGALNAVIAGSIIIAIGEGTSVVFERIYAGEKTLDDTEWARDLVESGLSSDVINKGTKVLSKVAALKSGSGKGQRKAIIGLLTEAFAPSEGKAEKEEKEAKAEDA